MSGLTVIRFPVSGGNAGHCLATATRRRAERDKEDDDDGGWRRRGRSPTTSAKVSDSPLLLLGPEAQKRSTLDLIGLASPTRRPCICCQ
ncbi:unnamed protein product [Heligmosomoides polygyrus]|uniref:Uncharacterized protein n=1 Tax=Heligmosomoides polygyrus TaxID=6339 RepID=A0A183FPR5_HELPZ|nr:unnamed protein product [Heligmosomoides polygyrus]